jgi:hypothetical protein
MHATLTDFQNEPNGKDSLISLCQDYQTNDVVLKALECKWVVRMACSLTNIYMSNMYTTVFESAFQMKLFPV